ncbi:MAG: nucleoside-triphosphatase [Desulfobulbaceae bacterium]|nr:nucleoside-triphosphatase [Desulfobulbaceae bacterium]
MSASGNVLLVTGTPGIGKTTIIRNVVRSLPDLHMSGFYTEEIRINTVRRGFELITLQGKRFVIAHIDIDSAYRVGKYSVDVAAIDTSVTLALSDDDTSDVFIVDEIGKMECFSDLFVQRMSSLLDVKKPVVATIAQKGGEFISAVKNRADVELWEVTKANRDDMPGMVVSWVRDKIKSTASN